jgi:hypothetical protein
MNGVFSAAVYLGRALLAAIAAVFGIGQPVHADPAQCLANVI